MEFLSRVEKHEDLWHQIYKRTRIPDEALETAASLGGPWHLLVLVEDWCTDGLHSLPILARLEEAVPQLDLRILSRDENPDLMDGHLTRGSQSMPVVMILDEDFREVAWWGPRPKPLQELFLRELKPLGEDERFAGLRTWYVRDRGKTVLAELLRTIPVSV